MTRPSGRFSRYPAVNRDVPAHGATYAERAGAGAPAPAPALKATEKVVPTEQRDVPDVESMTVAEVLTWAGNDPVRRAAALEAEVAGRGRRGIVDTLGG